MRTEQPGSRAQEFPWVPHEGWPRARSLTRCRSTIGLLYCGLVCWWSTASGGLETGSDARCAGPVGILSVGSRGTGAGREHPAVTWSGDAFSKRWAYEDRIGYRGPHGWFTLACRVRNGSISHQHKSGQIPTTHHLTRPQAGPQSSPHVNAPARREPMASRTGSELGKAGIAQSLGTVAHRSGQGEGTTRHQKKGEGQQIRA